MDDTPKQPSLLAHNVIKQMSQHMFGSSLEPKLDDFRVMRTAYRACGGLWAKLADGDIAHIDLLSKVVTEWGKMKSKKGGGNA